MSIRSEAAAALDAERDNLRAAAIAALGTVLDTGDGTPAVPLSGLTQNVVDLPNRNVVVTDDTSTPVVSLAVRDPDGDGTFAVWLVTLVNGRWTKVAGPLDDLADLGAALAEQGA